VLIPAAAALFGSLNLVRTRIAKWVLWVPVGIYGAWLVACKLHYGWFLYPENVTDFRFTAATIFVGWSFWTKRLLIDQHAWVLAAAGMLLLIWISRRHAVPPLLFAVLGLIVPGLPFLHALSAGLFVAFLWYGWNEKDSWRLMAAIPLFFTLLFSPYHYQFPRYLVPAWPAMTIILSRILLTRKQMLVVIPACIALFIWSASMKTWDGWQHHECNLQDMDFIAARKEAAQFLEANAGQRVIIARKPAEDLTNPAFGYVSAPLRVLREEELLRLRCKGLRRAHYYYHLPTQTRRSERRMFTLMKSCRTQHNVVFGSSHVFRARGTEKVAIYRLRHRRPRPRS
jgi:hypothetical protein